MYTINSNNYYYNILKEILQYFECTVLNTYISYILVTYLVQIRVLKVGEIIPCHQDSYPNIFFGNYRSR